MTSPNQLSVSNNFNLSLPPVSTFAKSPAVPAHGDLPPPQLSANSYQQASTNYHSAADQWLPYPGPQGGYIGRPVFVTNW